MPTINRVLARFDGNRTSVHDLMRFDSDVLEVAIARVEKLNDKWKAYLVRDARPDPSGRPPTPNPSYTADTLLSQLRGIRGHGSLRGRYDLILNQCIVLLVSFFGSAAHELCIALVARALKEERNPALLDLTLKVSVGDLRASGADWEQAVARSLVDAGGYSFQDMKSAGRAFRDLCGLEPPQDRVVNTIIMAQAARHAIVHSGARIDGKLLRQVENAHPRDLMCNPVEGDEISCTEGEIELVGDAMKGYLSTVAEHAL